ELPLEEIAEITIRNGPTVYLSELTPSKYLHTPFLGVSWPLGIDAGITGRQLRLGTDYYDKGLAMHTRSEVTYALAGKYRGLDALVGLEPQAGSLARAKIKVVL